MTAITSSALANMCGLNWGNYKEKSLVIFSRNGYEDYIFLYNLKNKKAREEYEFYKMYGNHLDFLPNYTEPFEFEVLEADMTILTDIGQKNFKHGYQQLFEMLDLELNDTLGGFFMQIPDEIYSDIDYGYKHYQELLFLETGVWLNDFTLGRLDGEIVVYDIGL